jgi:aldose sugar dehydrogenase
MVLAAGPALAADRVIDTEAGQVKVETVAEGLSNPWGLAFLPDGRMLVTERTGQLRIVSTEGEVSDAVEGVPAVLAHGQGGLLDVAVDPEFEESGLVYLTYSEAGEGGSSTALARGVLEGGALKDVKVLFRQVPKVDSGRHFGSRIVITPDGKIFVTTGDRGVEDPAQDLSDHIGTIVRINEDGSVPEDNPFIGRNDAQPEIWSYGHRNVQGAALHPETGELWTHEFGPKGGDELNIARAGNNYGWPEVSWGTEYSGQEIPDPPTRPEFEPALHYWVPAISPSGLTFYTADAIPGWKGNLLIGGLSSQALIRIAVDGEKVVGEEHIPFGARIRNVRQAPDGSVLVLTDDAKGRIERLTLAGEPG